MQRRLLTAGIIVAACAVLATWYALRAKREATVAALAPTGVVRDADGLAAVRDEPHALFRTTRVGEGYGHLVAVSLSAPGGTRYQVDLECDRVAAGPAGGVCLTAERSVQSKYRAVIFDQAFQPRHRLELSGIPSRVRLSPDGRLAGVTVFVAGHAYTDATFSTHTTLIDLERGTVLADLEAFTVERDGKPFTSADFNFWGVTFTSDSRTFYVTLGSARQVYLLRADAATRRATVIREGVECPALSPDNRRIAFKQRMAQQGRLVWRLAVLDLATAVHHLVEGEVRNVDDQVEWLDDRRIVYAVEDDVPGRGGTSLRSVDADGGVSTLWAEGAYSPAVIPQPVR